MVDALVAEEPGEDAAVGGEPRERDPRVVGDAEDLALVGGELGGGLVDGGKDDVGEGAEADAGGALLDGLHGILQLEEPPRGAPRRHVGVVLVPEHSRSSYSSTSFDFSLAIRVCGVGFGCFVDARSSLLLGRQDGKRDEEEEGARRTRGGFIWARTPVREGNGVRPRGGFTRPFVFVSLFSKGEIACLGRSM